MMNRNQKSAQTAMRTRRLMLKPAAKGEEEFGVNVLPIGTHIGEFEIKGLIGEGGFGIVYLAYDHSLERQVALKEYMPSGLATRTTKMAVSVRSQSKMDTFTAGLKSFINEARMLAQFDSQALVKVHSFWEGNGTAYMVMPYYEGMTLKQSLQTRRIKPTEGWIRMLLADLFDAIDILHRAHCLHRDIAPDNILLLKDGRPLLLDFGAARRVIGDLTQCFTAILKPGFAPIEQYADIAGLRQGAWTDIYALAAVVYYLITGKAPPPSVARMVHDELVPAQEAGKGRYSEAFLVAIDKALAVRPEQRFHSIEELRHALGIMEPEPRTVPYPGGEWTTTVARTAPVTPPGDEKVVAASAATADPPAAFAVPPAASAAPAKATATPAQASAARPPASAAPPAASAALPEASATPPASARPAARAVDAELTQHAAPPANAAEDVTAIAPPMPPTDPAPAVGSRAAPPDTTAFAGMPNERKNPGANIPKEKPRQPFSALPPRPSSEPRAESSERIEPELLPVTQMAGDWHNPHNQQMPPHRHEEDAAVPRRRDNRGWLVLALLFAAGIGSGIYLGTNHSWDGLSEQAIDAESRTPEPAPGIQPQASAQPSERSMPGVPPEADASSGATSSGSSDSSAAAGAPGTLGAPDQPLTEANRLRPEIDLWKAASKSNQVSGYEHYLREYPQGRYAAIARSRLDRLQAEAAEVAKPALPEPPAAEARKAEQAPPPSTAPSVSALPGIKPEEAAWSRATAINSAAAYREYLRKYPKGGYAALARDRLDNIKSATKANGLTTPSQETAAMQEIPAAPAAITAAPRQEAGVPPPQAQQSAQASVKRNEAPFPSAASPASPMTPPAASAPVTTPPTASALPTTQPPASLPASAATSPSTLPPQASATPAAPKEAAIAPERSAAAEPPAQATSAGKPADTTSVSPQASLTPRETTSSNESVSSGHAIKFADQTMTGDFTVDKKSGLVSGKGKISWSNGNQFEGTLVQGRKEGKGKFIWNSGQRYTGDWAHDLPNGRGVFNFPDGSRYEGEVKDGLQNGQGTTRFKNGIVYTGDWIKGKLHGHGRYIWADGSYWEGEFRDDKKTENGRMYFPNKGTSNASGAATADGDSRRAAAAADDKQSEEK